MALIIVTPLRALKDIAKLIFYTIICLENLLSFNLINYLFDTILGTSGSSGF